MVIGPFRGEFYFLSNFASSYVLLEGMQYSTVEHAYQAAKSLDLETRRKIQTCSTPGQAKRFGRSLSLRPDWESVKLLIMENLLRQKFSLPDYKHKLLSTTPHELIELNYWGDEFWGVDERTGKGLNHLGLLLMKIRSEG